MTTFGFFKVFGPYIAIAALIMVVLFIRTDKVKAEAERDTAQAEASQLREVNKANAATMARLSEASAANAKIAEDVAADVAAIRARGVSTRTIIQEASRNDPQVRDWASMPVPDGVRRALSPSPAN